MVNIPGRKPGKIRRVIAYVLMIAILAGILPQEAFALRKRKRAKLRQNMFLRIAILFIRQ